MPWCLASGKPRASHFGPEPSLFWAGFHRPSRKAVRWDVFFGFDKERTVKASLNWWAFDIFSSFPSLSACWFISWYRWFQFCSDGVPPFLLGYPLHAKSLGCNTAKKHTTHRRKSEESLPQRPGDLRNGVVGGPGVCLLTPACLGQGAGKNFQMSILSSHLKFFQPFKNVESVLTPRAEPHQKAGWTGPQSVVYWPRHKRLTFVHIDP